jgi:hypothetical protein
VFEIIIAILGIVASALFVGYLAFAIKSIPLWIIVVGAFVLMIREFIIEFGQDTNSGNRK